MKLTLRPISDEDIPHLYDIYASTRAEELALVPDWGEADKMAFLTQQFTAQHQYYQKVYQGADFQVIEYDNQPVGRLYIQWNFKSDEIRIIDIALLPAYRGKGIGTAILNTIFQKAAAASKCVTIHVEYNNPAMRLYERLGFRKIGEFNSVYYLMKWIAERDEEAKQSNERTN